MSVFPQLRAMGSALLRCLYPYLPQEWLDGSAGKKEATEIVLPEDHVGRSLLISNI